MKKLKTSSIANGGAILFIALLISCGQDAKIGNHSNEYFEKITGSDQFKSLAIDQSQIDLKSVQQTTTAEGRKSVSYIVKGSENVKLLMSTFDAKNDLLLVYTFESSYSANKIHEASTDLQNRTYNGSLTWTSSKMALALSVENSQIISKKMSMIDDKYAYPCTTDGIANCAGDTITNQGPFSKALCYAEFMICLAAAVGDCIVQNCPSSAV